MSEAKGIGEGIGYTIAVLAALGAGAIVYNGSASGGNAMQYIGPFAYALTNFTPFGLIMFGFIADIFGQEYRFSIPSIMAIISVIINRLIALSEPWFGLTPRLSNSDSGSGAWCFVPGMEALESRLLPMNFIIMGSILTYYLISATQARELSANTSMIIAWFLIPILQGLAFYLGGCTQWYAWGMLGTIGAFILGIIIGASTYAVIRSNNSVKLPFGYGVAGNSSSGYQSTPPVTSPLGGPKSGAKCSAADTDDNNAFVCEAYKNGVLVTEKIA
jgi:hypothetical protein